MADDHGPAGTAPYPPPSRFDERSIVPLLLRWDLDIKRAASAAARRSTLDKERIEDLAQEARLRIVRLARRGGPCEEPYLRTVIANAVRNAAHHETHFFEQLLPAENAWDSDRRDDIVDSPSQATSSPTDAVNKWIRGLSAKCQAIYELLYVRGHTQREAAAMIGITQPRVAQLHRELLRRGRLDLAQLAA